ncbi:MarR family winged helix-turn-helix transcriptional regulator [Amycolatopsis jiangsuensis]|uniref:DNA-binding MarR family transcriptional regulator n=1 Tax=Amycolatopsis jiangsuensis TaxID=1181879 RepID=A0A840J744_9PSEU|nr:MarR family transcriptional regulator [Amycolatopsis jiangsuensis]MBB4689197.1 DNA-binding MarR family transcriptional regulator [Amycolatopsis jiangsuensis]
MGEIVDTLDQMTSLVIRGLVVHRQAARAGLSMTATACLARLEEDGPLRTTTLAAAEGVSQPSMSQLVQRLERQEFVVRVSDPEDGRASLVALTESGRAVLAQRRAHRRKRIADLVASLPEQEAAALELAINVALPALRRLADTARETDLDAVQA